MCFLLHEFSLFSPIIAFYAIFPHIFIKKSTISKNALVTLGVACQAQKSINIFFFKMPLEKKCNLLCREILTERTKKLTHLTNATHHPFHNKDCFWKNGDNQFIFLNNHKIYPNSHACERDRGGLTYLRWQARGRGSKILST